MKGTDKYVFPAVLTYEAGQEIAVTFPDLPCCATSGVDDLDALSSAKEVLGLCLWGMEQDGENIPQPSKLKDVQHEDNEAVALIDVYMPAIRLAQENRAVNRTVTLPAWLNAKATEYGMNFSQILQDALKKEVRRRQET